MALLKAASVPWTSPEQQQAPAQANMPQGIRQVPEHSSMMQDMLQHTITQCQPHQTMIPVCCYSDTLRVETHTRYTTLPGRKHTDTQGLPPHSLTDPASLLLLVYTPPIITTPHQQHIRSTRCSPQVHCCASAVSTHCTSQRYGPGTTC